MPACPPDRPQVVARSALSLAIHSPARVTSMSSAPRPRLRVGFQTTSPSRGDSPTIPGASTAPGPRSLQPNRLSAHRSWPAKNATREVAAVAEAADIGWYGGTMLETSIGSAASAHVFATLGSQHHGCELFGPQLLVDDIVTARMEIKDFELQLPDGPGFGVEVDLKQLDRFDRARTGLAPTHIDLGQQAAPKP